MKRFASTFARVPWRSVAARTLPMLLAATMASATACTSGGEPTGPRNDSFEGSYSLSAIDLQPPPVTIHNGPWFDANSGTFYNLFTVQIVNGEIELDGDDRFSMSLSGVISGDGQVGASTVSVTGFYEIDGDQIWLTADDESFGSTSAMIAQHTIRMPMDLMGKGVANNFYFEK